MSSVDAHIDPDFAACWFYDGDVCTVQGSHVARGKFTVFLGLTLDQHLLFHLCSESRLAGDFGNVVPDKIMSAGFETLVAEARTTATFIQDAATGFTSLGGAPALLTCPGGGAGRAWSQSSRSW